MQSKIMYVNYIDEHLHKKLYITKSGIVPEKGSFVTIKERTYKVVLIVFFLGDSTDYVDVFLEG
mgnify:CR=1 FL=1